jgi:hypothetical protein
MQVNLQGEILLNSSQNSKSNFYEAIIYMSFVFQRSEPYNCCDKDLLDQLEGDEEWRSLTLEEQSLTQEEECLKREIEEVEH